MPGARSSRKDRSQGLQRECSSARTLGRTSGLQTKCSFNPPSLRYSLWRARNEYTQYVAENLWPPGPRLLPTSPLLPLPRPPFLLASHLPPLYPAVPGPHLHPPPGTATLSIPTKFANAGQPVPYDSTPPQWPPQNSLSTGLHPPHVLITHSAMPLGVGGPAGPPQNLNLQPVVENATSACGLLSPAVWPQTSVVHCPPGTGVHPRPSRNDWLPFHKQSLDFCAPPSC